mmetsp:Transcript_106132/g.174295  ORF Transcript_106132/g.174295 Transcript_106132/m.174295 type:complete len:89 (+) Transcript_106132:222-488(+)
MTPEEPRSPRHGASDQASLCYSSQSSVCWSLKNYLLPLVQFGSPLLVHPLCGTHRPRHITSDEEGSNAHRRSRYNRMLFDWNRMHKAQ